MAFEFAHNLSERLRNRIELASEGHRVYVEAVGGAFGSEVDYAMLVKTYGSDSDADETGYSPAGCIGCRATPITWKPDAAHINASYAERQNWSVRIAARRRARASNELSRKIEDHSATVALYRISDDFMKIRRTLRVTPGMAASVTDRLGKPGIWSVCWKPRRGAEERHDRK